MKPRIYMTQVYLAVCVPDRQLCFDPFCHIVPADSREIAEPFDDLVFPFELYSIVGCQIRAYIDVTRAYLLPSALQNGNSFRCSTRLFFASG